MWSIALHSHQPLGFMLGLQVAHIAPRRYVTLYFGFIGFGIDWGLQ